MCYLISVKLRPMNLGLMIIEEILEDIILLEVKPKIHCSKLLSNLESRVDINTQMM